MIPKTRRGRVLIRLAAPLALMLLCGSLSVRADIIFSEDFSGGTDDLNGIAPDIRPDAETWIAAPIFNQDGSLNPDAGSATLAFTPVDGNVYVLDLSLTGVTGDQNWFALGFGSGQSANVGFNNRFINGLLIGKAWMLFRGNTNGHQAFRGNATAGTADGAPWTALEMETGEIDMRIELDTTGGAGAWAATWFAKKPADSSYVEVRARETLLDESINSVGIALARGLVDGTIESFRLSTCPQPSAQFAVIAVDYAPVANTVTLTWDSQEGEMFAAKFSRDMTNWEAEIEDEIEADAGDTTTKTFDLSTVGLSGAGRVYFRIERQ